MLEVVAVDGLVEDVGALEPPALAHPPRLERQPVEEHEPRHRRADHILPQPLGDTLVGVLERPAHGQSVSGVHAMSSSQVSSSRAPKPVAPLLSSPRSTSERPVPAMSRCAHRRSPANSRRNKAAVIEPAPPLRSRNVVDVGDLAVEVGSVVLHQRQRPQRLAGAPSRRHQGIAQGLVRGVDRRHAPTERDACRAGEGGDVQEDVGVEVQVGVGQGVGEDETALCVGVPDLDGPPAVLRDDVPGR